VSIAAAAVGIAAAAAIAAGDMRLALRFGRWLFATLTVLLPAMPSAASSDFFRQTTFSSAEEGMQAFVDTITLNDPFVLQTLLGAEGLTLFETGDAAADAQWRKRFLSAYADAHKVVFKDNNTRAILTVGRDEWPMPIPLVKSEAGWRFDTPHAAEEILNRHIGRNELRQFRSVSLLSTPNATMRRKMWMATAFLNLLRNSSARPENGTACIGRPAKTSP
jgi:hypothetical protein